MDVNQIITLGVGTPSDIPHFILFGLSAASGSTTDVSGSARFSAIFIKTATSWVLTLETAAFVVSENG